MANMCSTFDCSELCADDECPDCAEYCNEHKFSEGRCSWCGRSNDHPAQHLPSPNESVADAIRILENMDREHLHVVLEEVCKALCILERLSRQ